MRNGNNPYPTYPDGNLDRRPSRISEKTSPNTSQSIIIDVVPPVSYEFSVKRSKLICVSFFNSLDSPQWSSIRLLIPD